MAFDASNYDTETLIGTFNLLPPYTAFFLDQFFQIEQTFDQEYIDFDRLRAGRTLAPFVAPNVQGKPVKARGFETRRFRPAYIKPKDALDPTRAIKRRPGEALKGSQSIAQRMDAIVVDQQQEHRDMIMRRWEWMAAQAVIFGKVTVVGDDYPSVTVDFQRPASHTITNSGGAAWDQTTATPLEDIDNDINLVFNDSGYAVNRVIMDTLAWGLFKNSDEVKEKLETRRGSTSTLETALGDGQQLQYKGTVGAQEIWVYAGTYEGDDGTMQKIMPDYSYLLVGGGADGIAGIRAFGAILDNKAGFRAMPIFQKVFENEDPSVVYLLSQSAPLFIPARPEASLLRRVKV